LRAPRQGKAGEGQRACREALEGGNHGRGQGHGRLVDHGERAGGGHLAAAEVLDVYRQRTGGLFGVGVRLPAHDGEPIGELVGPQSEEADDGPGLPVDGVEGGGGAVGGDGVEVAVSEVEHQAAAEPVAQVAHHLDRVVEVRDVDAVEERLAAVQAADGVKGVI